MYKKTIKNKRKTLRGSGVNFSNNIKLNTYNINTEEELKTVPYTSHTLKKNKQYYEKRNKYGNTPSQKYLNLLNQLQTHLNTPQTENEFIKSMAANEEKARVEYGMSENDIKSMRANMITDWRKTIKKQQTEISGIQKQINTLQKNSEKKQAYNSNYAKLLANINLNNTNTNNDYQRKIKNKINSTYKSNKNISKRSYFEKKLNEMF